MLDSLFGKAGTPGGNPCVSRWRRSARQSPESGQRNRILNLVVVSKAQQIDRLLFVIALENKELAGTAIEMDSLAYLGKIEGQTALHMRTF